ncbi:pyrimidine 5-nucleotidase [Rickenella mellea]|uniref:Pyrimidine 5-nucleotidase n=1 Tax=Rickenella mellea TaxID=50990 RepID=A0A4R5XEJ5_9AGAM|nr:pyrimidine 5-nucleotidase [Rickenella mellea]
MANATEDGRYIVWLDIDNTLYSSNAKIADAMGQRIHAYFVSLGLRDEEASELHSKYYTQYGLALRGLVRHHEIDALDFDRRCDGSLPLEDMIKPDPSIRQLLEDIDTSKARIWGLTNAYHTHARRVLHILQLEDLFEGLVYCNYADPNFTCKPEPEFFTTALTKAGVADPSKCLFVDDSRNNVQAARRLDWGSCVHFCEGSEKGIATSSNENREITISCLEELRNVWPQIFKSTDK